MNPLSQQIRDLISQSTTSTYAIARAADIDKSAMSRFMNGGNLTMDKLDKLAEVLGVIVTSEVSRVPMPLLKGRPKERIKSNMDTQTADKHASRLARIAYRDYFSSRRGVWHIEDIDCLAYYNNNPFRDPAIRQQELATIKDGLKNIGIEIIGQGFYGEDENLPEYTVALLLDCSADRLSEVTEIASSAATDAIATANK